MDTPGVWTLDQWKIFALFDYGPRATVTPLAELLKARPRHTLDNALAAACEGVEGITPAEFRSLLPPRTSPTV